MASLNARQKEEQRNIYLKDTYFLVEWIGEDLYDVLPSKQIIPPENMSVFDIGEGTVCKGAFNGKHYQTRIIARGRSTDMRVALSNLEKDEDYKLEKGRNVPKTQVKVKVQTPKKRKQHPVQDGLEKTSIKKALKTRMDSKDRTPTKQKKKDPDINSSESTDEDLLEEIDDRDQTPTKKKKKKPSKGKYTMNEGQEMKVLERITSKSQDKKKNNVLKKHDKHSSIHEPAKIAKKKLLSEKQSKTKAKEKLNHDFSEQILSQFEEDSNDDLSPPPLPIPLTEQQSSTCSSIPAGELSPAAELFSPIMPPVVQPVMPESKIVQHTDFGYSPSSHFPLYKSQPSLSPVPTFSPGSGMPSALINPVLPCSPGTSGFSHYPLTPVMPGSSLETKIAQLTDIISNQVTAFSLLRQDVDAIRKKMDKKKHAYKREINSSQDDDTISERQILSPSPAPSSVNDSGCLLGDPKGANVFIEGTVTQSDIMSLDSSKSPQTLALKLFSLFFTKTDMANGCCTRTEDRNLLSPKIVNGIKYHVDYKFPIEELKERERWHQIVVKQLNAKCRASRLELKKKGLFDDSS